METEGVGQSDKLMLKQDYQHPELNYLFKKLLEHLQKGSNAPLINMISSINPQGKQEGGSILNFNGAAASEHLLANADFRGISNGWAESARDTSKLSVDRGGAPFSLSPRKEDRAEGKGIDLGRFMNYGGMKDRLDFDTQSVRSNNFFRGE